MKRFAGDAACCLAIVAISLVLGLSRYRDGIDLGDEGFLAYGAVRVLEGQMPNRDFVSLQPPLSFYTVATVFKLFGISLISLRTLGLCIYVLIPVLVYALSRHLTGRGMALAAAVPATVLGMPFFSFVPFAVWHGVIATLTVAVLFMRATATSQRWWALLAGLTTALVILSRHDQGFYVSVAVLAYALALKFAKWDTIDRPHIGQMLGFWAAGVAALMLPLGVYWLLSGAVPYMFKQIILFPLTTYAKTSSLPMPVFRLGQPLQQNVLVALFYLPPVVEGLATVWLLVRLLRRRFYVEHASVAFILVLSTLFYCQVLTRSDLHHPLITLAPFFVLCVVVIGAASNAVGSVIGRMYGRQVSFFGAAAVLFVAGAIGMWFLLYTKPVFIRSLKQPSRTLLLDRGGVRLGARHAYLLEDVIKMIQEYTDPDRSILCLPYHPMFYFLSARRNPTRWNYLWPGDQAPDDHQALIKQAQNDPPAVVMIIRRSEVQRFAPAIIDYVHSEYRVARNLGGLTLYLPVDQER